ncbi:thioesterase II family protein [Kitasatospora sp. MBT63]|uniref:thioesterase II family protein n=1 Tax=Kitasatospora sp. MBT63 TaxID=1444768 RepID=UPI0005397C93|nr:alpha/beta fold hydrolase [Kitasatospora sp. MBT63]
MTSDRWLRRFHPGGDARARLVCFPHAGGSASYWHPLSGLLSPRTEVLAVQYPGRQDRFTETPLRSITELAARAVDALGESDGRPLLLLGHSMGAVVAYEAARLLESSGAGPDLLMVSGRRAPHLRRPEAAHLLDDRALLAHLASLDGTDAGLLADPEIVALALPAVRADYAALTGYQYREREPLRCPVTALVGDDDPVTSPADARGWERYTAAGFDLKVFPGGHFYLNGRHDEIAAVISRHLEALV